MPCRIYISAVQHSKQVFTVQPSTAHGSKQKPGNNSSGGYSGRRGYSPPRDATRRVFATHHNARLYAYSHSHPDSYHKACLFAYSHHLPVAAHHNAYAYHLPNAYYDIRAESVERCVDWGRLDVCGSSDV